MIALADIGAFVALAFADPARYLGAAVAIAGDELTPPQTAQALSQATGQHIRHVQIPVEAVRQHNSDLADAVRQHNSDLADAVSYLNSHGGYGADIAAARAPHRGLRTFGAWLAEPGRARLDALLGSSRVATRLSAMSRHERRQHHRDHRRQLGDRAGGAPLPGRRRTRGDRGKVAGTPGSRRRRTRPLSPAHHAGLVNAIAAVLPGAARQRCRTH
jgi:NmrA-like family